MRNKYITLKNEQRLKESGKKSREVSEINLDDHNSLLNSTEIQENNFTNSPLGDISLTIEKNPIIDKIPLKNLVNSSKEIVKTDYKTIFEDIIKEIDKEIKKNNENGINRIIDKNIKKYFDDKYDITLIIDIKNNTLPQYYLNQRMHKIALSIVETYYNILKLNINEFYKWIMNDNIIGQNLFEIGLSFEDPVIDIENEINFYNELFGYIIEVPKLIYDLLNKRINNIIHLASIQNKVHLLLIFYEKLNKFFPSTNIINIENQEGKTALHFACLCSNKSFADFLLNLKADVNAKDCIGNTPLHYAVKHGNFTLVKKLLIYGADKFTLNSDNKSPLDFVDIYGNSSMKSFFYDNSNKIFENLCKTKFCNEMCYNSSILGKKNHIIYVYFLTSCFLINFFALLYSDLEKNKDLILYNKKYSYKNLFIIFISLIFDILSMVIFVLFKINGKGTINTVNLDNSFEKLMNKCKYNEKKIYQICCVCHNFKKPATKHCILCNKCIDNFNHHCFWVNECISEKNYKLFLFFISTNLFTLIFNLIAFIKIYIFNKNYTESLSIKIFFSLILIFIIIFLSFCIIVDVEQIYIKIKEDCISFLNKNKSPMTLEEYLITNKSLERNLKENPNIRKSQ